MNFIVGKEYRIKNYKEFYEFYYYYEYGHFNYNSYRYISDGMYGVNKLRRKSFFITSYYDFKRIDFKSKLVQFFITDSSFFVLFDKQEHKTQLPISLLELFKSFFEQASLQTYQEEFEI